MLRTLAIFGLGWWAAKASKARSESQIGEASDRRPITTTVVVDHEEDPGAGVDVTLDADDMRALSENWGGRDLYDDYDDWGDT